MNRTSGPAHRTDGGDDSPDNSESPEESKDHSQSDDSFPIHSGTTPELNAIEEQGDIEEAGGIEQILDNGVEKSPQKDKRVLIADQECAVTPSSSKNATNSTAQNSGASDDDNDTVVQELPSESKAKKWDLLFMKVVLGLLLISVLVAGFFLLYFYLQPTSTEHKVKELGFPYRKDMKNGWLFDANRDTTRTSHTHYSAAELISEGLGATEVDCATKCASDEAFAGAWNTFYQECWCYLDSVPNADFCFETCIIEEGIEFSSVKLQTSFEWCPASYCDIFDAQEYCDFRPKKNVTDCRST
ncbi:MAG: hypothetical protein SGBAC_006027 [Bacillariaceae sp.]